MCDSNSLSEQAGVVVVSADPDVVTESDVYDDVPGPWVYCTAGYNGCTFGGWAAEMMFYDSCGEWTCPSCHAAIEGEYADYEQMVRDCFARGAYAGF